MASNNPYQPKTLQYRTAANIADIAYGPNQNVDPSADLRGAAFVVIQPIPGGQELLAYYEYEALHSVNEDPITLLTMNGFSDAEEAIVYLQCFLIPPTMGMAPFEVFRLSPGASFSWTPSVPLPLTGLYVGASSSPSTYTALVENTWLRVEYTQAIP